MTRARAVFVAAATVAGAVFVGCTGILGLDATTLGGSDASAGDGSAADGHAGSDAPSDGTTGDAGPDSPSGDTGAADSGSDGAPPDGPVFTTSPAIIGLHPDASLDVTVSVVRAGLLGPLAITFTQLPTGVTSGTSTIAADAGSTQVTVQAAASAPPASVDAGLQANGVTYASVPVVVYAPSGSNDTTFAGGYVLDNGDPTGSVFTAVAVDPSGRIVAGGPRAGGGWFVRRYGSDGAADTTFDTAANAALPATGTLGGLAIEPSTGVIVCAGTVSSQLTVVVLDPSGNASGAFNSGSPFAFTAAQTQASAASAVAIEPGQRFAVVGGTGPALISFLVADIPEVGAASPSAVPTYAGGTSTTFTSVAVEPSGKIVAAGTSTSGQPIILLQRFTGATLDSTFGSGGTGAGSTAFCAGTSVAVRPSSGGVLVGGSNDNTDVGCYAGWSDAGQNAFQDNGSGGGGGAFTYWGATPMGDPADHVYMVGSGGDSFAWSAELDRVNAGGAFDATFGSGGKVVLSDSNSPPLFSYVLRAVAVQADGRIVIAGSKKDSTGTFPVLARFWP